MSLAVSRIVLFSVVTGCVVWSVATQPRLPAAERGRRVAERSGCFTCHGPSGLAGAANPGRRAHSVPGFTGDVMMYARDAQDLREWILDGVPKRRAESHSWQQERDAGALRMPAFRGRLSDTEVDDLVAFIRAQSGDPEPEDSLAAAGLVRAEALGCTGCHGPGGRLAPPNPGSFKGYVPSWDGPDFGELVRDRAEFGEWVERGVAARMAANPAARFFLRRASLHMPAYARHLAPDSSETTRRATVDTLWAYVQWLRRTPH